MPPHVKRDVGRRTGGWLHGGHQRRQHSPREHKTSEDGQSHRDADEIACADERERHSNTEARRAGTYAENESCAVSCTGHGELFIRHTVASDIAARVKYRKDSLEKAADDVLAGLPKEKGGVGGLIALDRTCRAAMAYNTPAMFRASITQSGKISVAVYED